MMRFDQFLKKSRAGVIRIEKMTHDEAAIKGKSYFGEWLYILALVLFIGLTLLDAKTALSEILPSWLFSAGRYVCLALMLAKILICRDYRHYNRSAFFRIVLALIVCGTTTVVSGSRLPIQYLIVIIAAYGISFNHIVKSVLISEALMATAVMLASLLGLIPNDFHIRASTGEIRYNLGFSFATYPAILTYYLSTLYLFVRKEKIRLLECIVIIALNALLFILTDTKTELIMTICAVLGFVLLKYKSDAVCKALRLLSIWMMPVLTVFGVVLAIGYQGDNPVHRELNSALSGRVALAHKAMDEYGITPFGNDIEWIDLNTIETEGLDSSEHNVVDIGYLHILYNYGLVFLVAFILIYTKTLLFFLERGEPYSVLLIVIMAMHMFITPQMIQIVYNVTLVLLVRALIPNGKEEHDFATF